MVNPALTIVFDLFLIGAATAVIASMVKEYLDSRSPSVGRGRPETATVLEVHARTVPAPLHSVGASGSRTRQTALRRPHAGRAPGTLRSRTRARNMAHVI